MKKLMSLLAALGLFALAARAQLSSNPDKFLGNITTSGQVDFGSEPFYTLWNQITPENESKWSSIEGSARGRFNWPSDAAYNYAKLHSFPFKFHTLIWGAQYPGWMDNLSTGEQYKAIVEWMDAVKAHYPDLKLIDVVNEAIPGHQPAPYKEALGGDGRTGYDWIIKAFEMAHERWPDAILIYNDYNTFQWNRSEFIELVRILRDAGAPIDAYGCQSHDLTDMGATDFKNAMTEIQNALKMPMYSTEYDISTADDAKQLQRYKEQIPYMWEADYCAGITFWGYIYGRTWVEGGTSGIIRDGADRPAMTWLREYMASDKARTAKSPFPGMVKEASVYVKPASLNVTEGEPVDITIHARLRTKTIEKVELLVNNVSVAQLTEEPYVVSYTPSTAGKFNLKAVVTATDGTTYERLSAITANEPRAPFKNTLALPGTLQAEDFDIGGEGIAFHDTDGSNQGGTSYRKNGGGVDIVSKNGGYAIGYTQTGEWLEYTVNVQEEGLYDFDAYVALESGSGSFSLMLSTDDGQQRLTEATTVASTGNWNTLKAVHGRLQQPLQAGTQRIRLYFDQGGFDIDRILFKHVEVNEDLDVTLQADPAPATVNVNTTLTATISGGDIKGVRFYANNVLFKSVTREPYQTTYKATAQGTVEIMAVAVDADDRVSKVATYALKVNPKRTPYDGIITIPGIIELENFDKGAEDFTFHDSDTKDEGKANYRTDNGGVDIMAGNGGYVLGYTRVGEWLEYSINITEPGRYAYEATLSAGVSGAGFTISLLNEEGEMVKVATAKVPQTGNNTWDNYRVLKGSFTRLLPEGPNILRVTITGADVNLDKLELKCTLNTPVDMLMADEATDSDALYNLWGMRVGRNYRGIVIKNGRKFFNTGR